VFSLFLPIDRIFRVKNASGACLRFKKRGTLRLTLSNLHRNGGVRRYRKSMCVPFRLPCRLLGNEGRQQRLKDAPAQRIYGISAAFETPSRSAVSVAIRSSHKVLWRKEANFMIVSKYAIA